ncbi:DciA family protein [Streptomyces sp. NPDC059524]|uniref:DciA family protein n=1 Tax=Streptomyces sp. NPDC059524 TaxID=3346856 RepID=UPI0036AE9E4E
MSDTPTASGADLARQALAAARAAAKTKPTTKPKKRASRIVRGGGRDPQTLGGVLAGVAAEQGWTAGMDGGGVLADWPRLCPTALAHLVTPVGYDPDTGRLTVRPANSAAAAHLRLMQRQFAKHINDQLARPAIRALRILPPGADTPALPQEAAAAPRPEAPIRTRDTACDGYKQALKAHLAAKPAKEPTNPYLIEALARQDAALRANREPEEAHRDMIWELDRLAAQQVDERDAPRQRALAHKRREQEHGPTPVRRAFDIA